jgi:dipeptidyl-peptidase 4
MMRTRSFILVLASAALIASAGAVRAETPAGAPKKLTVKKAFDLAYQGDPVPHDFTWSKTLTGAVYYFPHKAKGAPDLMMYDAATGKRSVFLSQEAVRSAYGRLHPKIKKDALEKIRFGGTLVSPHGNRVLLSIKGGAFLYDRTTGKLKPVLEEKPGSPKAKGRLVGRGYPAPGHEKSFAFSPDGARLAFSDGGSLYVLDNGSAKARLLVKGSAPDMICGAPDWLYAEELDVKTGLWWSHDGRKIAFLRFDETKVPSYPLVDQVAIHPKVQPQKYPQAGDANPAVSVGVVDVQTGKPETLPGAESGQGYIPRVGWTPNDKAVVFMKLNRDQTWMALYKNVLGTNESRLLVKDTQKTWVNVFQGPWFLKDGRFLWLSERTGYCHIYLYGPDGKLIRPLTHGTWVVDRILGVDPEKGWVYFSANATSPLDEDFCRTSLATGHMKILSKMKGWHNVEVSPEGRYFVDRYSNVTTPPQIYVGDLHNGSRRRLFAKAPDTLSSKYGFVKPQFVTVKADDGTTLYGKLYKPAHMKPGKKYPVVIEVYGGPGIQLVTNRWVRYWGVSEQLFPADGYVYFQLDNRGSFRRGKTFEDSDYKRFGKTELEDQLAGLKYLKTLPYVDGSRVGIWGWSYGGFMTLYALTHVPAGTFKAGVSVAPVTNWLNYDTCYTERYLKTPKEDPEGYKKSSPVHFAADLSAPVLIQQGLMDSNVHFGNSVQMVKALLKTGKPFWMAYYPQQSHGIRNKADHTSVYARMLEFFNRHLKH